MALEIVAQVKGRCIISLCIDNHGKGSDIAKAGRVLLEPDLRTSPLRPEPSAKRAGQRLTSPVGGRSCDLAA